MSAIDSTHRLPTPPEFFGRRPLDDDVVIRWAAMVAYFRQLSELDRRLKVCEIGRDWSGRPLLLLVLGDGASEAKKTTIAVTAGIHAHELAGSQLMPDLVHDLLAAKDDATAAMLEKITLLIVPCVNPGGLEIVAGWREKTRGEPYEGARPPGLAHPVGHDLNRDWIMQTQPETRAVAEHVFNAWRPDVVLDLHEMAPNGPRYALPPCVEPVDPNIPLHIQSVTGAYGAAIAAALNNEGKTGVTTGLFFDGFSPARAYAPYHGGVRILAEAAGTRLGLPVHLSSDELASTPNFDPRSSSPNHMQPWPGGRWTLAGAASYHRTTILTTLRLAAKHGSQRIDFANPSREPEQAFVVLPLALQRDPGAALALLETLHRGAVEISQARSPFEHGGVEFPSGCFIVSSDQPNWPWAKSLLGIQHYVMPTSGCGGVTRPPYDVTAQTLPLLMGVDVAHGVNPTGAVLAPYRPSPKPSPRLPSGPRIGIYESWRPDASDAGWAMLTVQHQSPKPSFIRDAQIKAGDLDDFDVIILPHQESKQLIEGLNLAEYPLEFTGGIGRLGLRRLKRWVSDGGTLIAIDGACRAIVPGMNLPVSIAPRDYSAPGSIVRIELNPNHPVTAGCERELAVMTISSVAFDTTRTGVTGVQEIARYPAEYPLLSGWLSGADALMGRSAIVECRIGRGRIVLFGCRPFFRGQAIASQRLVLNATAQARRPQG